MKELKFYKAPAGTWWLDSPEYILQGGDPRELQMVAGADDLLDILSEDGGEVKLQVVEQKTKGFNELKRCDEIPTISGKYYFDDSTDLLLWLCPVTMWVFGGIYPETIYYKKV